MKMNKTLGLGNSKYIAEVRLTWLTKPIFSEEKNAN